jgi:hypothetical protein
MLRWSNPPAVNSLAGLRSCLNAALLATLVAVLMIVALAPHASAATVFRVDGVMGDATAENVLVAKEQAFSQASANALSALYQRLARSRDISRLPEPTPELAEKLTSVFQVMAEEASLVRYRVRARVSFNPDLVIGLFRRHGVTAFTQVSSPVLIVPVLERSGIPVVFDEAGEWFETLQKLSKVQHGLVPIKVALGTSEDRMEPLEFLRRGERISLDALRLRYDAQGVVVATVRYTPGRTAVQVEITGHNGAAPLATRFDAEGGFNDAARQLQAFLEEAWKANMRGGVAVSQSSGMPRQSLDPAPRQRRSYAPRTLQSGVRVTGERWWQPSVDPAGGSR